MDLFFSPDLALGFEVFGYLGLFGVIFAETGFFLSPLLPADSLLLSAAFLATQGYFDLTTLLAVGFLGAFLGDNLGYALGRRIGPFIFTREDSRLFSKKSLERTRRFFTKHGAEAVLLARIIPGIRAFGPFLAGAGQMRYSLFLIYDVIGSVVWSVGLSLLGYFMGDLLPTVGWYIFPVLAGFLLISSFIGFWRVWRDVEEKEELKAIFRKIFHRYPSSS